MKDYSYWYKRLHKFHDRQFKWAIDYLTGKGAALLPVSGSTIDDLINTLIGVPDNPNWREIVRNLMGGLAQQKFKDKNDGKKSYTFRISPTARDHLEVIAKKNKKTISEALEQLISADQKRLLKLKKTSESNSRQPPESSQVPSYIINV